MAARALPFAGSPAFPPTHDGGELRHRRDFRVIEVDDQRSVLLLTANHCALLIGRDLGMRLELGGIAAMNPDEIREWAVLEDSGLLENVHSGILARSRYEDGANLALNINLTGSCNLACTYCFADGGDYGRIRNKMQSETVDYIFDFIRQHVTSSRVVRFEFFGGEPLLNFPRIQEICDRADQFSDETGVRFIHRISTNLTVLPPQALALFKSKSFIVSVSIDGGPETHNRNRPTKGGRESYSRIMENVEKVRACGDEITLVARMTVVSADPPLGENVRELWQQNLFDYFQIYPGVTAPGTAGCGTLVQLGPAPAPAPEKATMNGTMLAQLADFLDNDYRNLFQPDNRFKGVLEYERIVEMVMAGKMALAFCSAGETYYTFSPDDSIMPCHRLVGKPEFQAGTGAEGLNADLRDWVLPVDAHPVCSGCWARYICGGNCRQENFLATGSLRGLNEETCRYQQKLIEAVVRYMAASDRTYLDAQRRLDDLFVSCGRPVVSNRRPDPKPRVRDLAHFRLLTVEQ